MIVADGATASTAFSPAALARLYCEEERSSAPIAETCTMRAPAPAAAFATVSAPLACTASKVWPPLWVRMPTRLTATPASRIAACDRGRVAQIGLHGVDLADAAERLQMARQFRPAHGDADAVAALGQRPHHVPAQKAGAAEHRDERFLVGWHEGVSCSQKPKRWLYLADSRYAIMPFLYSAFGPQSADLTITQGVLSNPPGPRWRNW